MTFYNVVKNSHTEYIRLNLLPQRLQYQRFYAINGAIYSSRLPPCENCQYYVGQLPRCCLAKQCQEQYVWVVDYSELVIDW